MTYADPFFDAAAQKEYFRACRRYAKTDIQLAQRFRMAVNEAVQRIAENPGRWPVYDGRSRWINYVLYYQQLDEERVLILAVAHGSRRPGYWKRRLRP